MPRNINDNYFTGNVYALSDIHGCIEIYRQVKAFLQPEDVVFFLGDAGDRGPHSWECIEAIYNDPQFFYLMGNHEDMLVKAMRGRYNDVNLCRYNGGGPTLNSWDGLSEEEREEWKHRLANLPVVAFYNNNNDESIIMSHSGWFDEETYINRTPAQVQLVYSPPFWTIENYLWDRMGLYDDVWRYNENEYVVHGHSPIPLSFEACDTKEELEAWKPEIMYYCAGHKIDIDCGTHYTGDACLLDLNTWDEHYFETSERIL